jgi:diguanylate cyclase (GGDEF)-like protein
MKSQETIHILLVEDEPGNARLLREMLKESTPEAAITHVRHIAEVDFEKNKKPRPNVVLLDLNFPDGQGLKPVTKTQEIFGDVPIIVLTGLENEELSLASIQAGAQDYLIKGKMNAQQLKRTIQYAIRRHQALTKINQLGEKQKAYLSSHDILTGLLNQQAFLEQLEITIKNHEITKKPFGLILIELHEINKIIDNYGHSGKDKVLKSIARQLTKALAAQDCYFACYHENVTAIILNTIPDKVTTHQIMSDLKNTLSNRILLGVQGYFPSYNIGVVSFPDDGNNPEDLIKNAQIALKKSQEYGTKRYEIYTKKLASAAQKNRSEIWHSDLQFALDRNEFFVVYQPQINISSNAICGMEALLRWQHPVHGVIFPEEFIPVAEDSRLIVPIGEWVLDAALKQYQIWQNQIKASLPGRLSVNISAHQLIDSRFVEKTRQLLNKYQVYPDCLALELTESIFLTQPKLMIDRLGQFRKMGVQTAIDDFGQGYSALSYLSHLPINQLKIDMAFIQKSVESEAMCIIIQSIITLAHSLNLNVIAEGVENAAQFELLKAQLCDEIQGYYFADPLSPSDFERYCVSPIIPK